MGNKVMSREEQMANIEGILFAYGDSLSLSSIAESIGETEEETLDAIMDLKLRYKTENRGLMIVRAENRFQMCTNPAYYDYVKKVIDMPENKAITDIQMQVLTFIAYKQPVTKTEIDFVRGSDSLSVIGKLIDAGLVEEQGKLRKKGNPLVYGTTEAFLKRFGLSSLDDLPRMDWKRRENILEEAKMEIHQAFTG